MRFALSICEKLNKILSEPQEEAKRQNNMKKLLMFLLILLPAVLHAQSDTIFYLDGRNEGCKISKITDKDVEFSYPNEDLVNVVKKNTILQIKFSSGRTQVFNEAAELSAHKHGEFWGIPMGCDLKKFLQQLNDKGARLIEYQDDNEVKLEARFMSFESADIYVHYNPDKIVTYVDVQQNHCNKRRKEMQGILTELNSKYTLEKEGGRPWLIAIYKWIWSGENVRVVLSRGSGYARPHLCFYDTMFGYPEDEE